MRGCGTIDAPDEVRRFIRNAIVRHFQQRGIRPEGVTGEAIEFDAEASVTFVKERWHSGLSPHVKALLAGVVQHQSFWSQKPCAMIGPTYLRDEPALSEISSNSPNKQTTPERRLVTPLHLALREQEVPAVELLISNGASVNTVAADGSTPLHSAATVSDEVLVRMLLARFAGACTTQRDPPG